ncbi:MAG: hypothetical protein OWU32_04745 [Firmicutes bacterium]|nr:hypothetical protein [Bacillota bacterium]
MVMSKRMKVGFFFLALFAMACMAAGAVGLDGHFAAGMTLVCIGLVAAASGFVVKAFWRRSRHS